MEDNSISFSLVLTCLHFYNKEGLHKFSAVFTFYFLNAVGIFVFSCRRSDKFKHQLFVVFNAIITWCNDTKDACFSRCVLYENVCCKLKYNCLQPDITPRDDSSPLNVILFIALVKRLCKHRKSIACTFEHVSLFINIDKIYAPLR